MARNGHVVVQQQPPTSSQAGPSQTPRKAHSQLPPSNSCGLLTSTRITPLPQAQTSPHQQQQPTPGQQPIAPRPPHSSTSAAAAPPATAASSSEPFTISRLPLVAMPDGLGQGLVRLLQFSDVLSSENPTKHQLSHWENVVKDYFTPKAIMKLTLWKDNQRNELKLFEIGFPTLPRFFLVTTQCGVKSMRLSLDGAQERLLSQHHAVVECVAAVWTYRYTNGYTVTLRGPLTVHVLTIPHANTAPSQSPSYSFKFDHLQFEANYHEKSIALDSVMGHRQSESSKTPRVRMMPTPSPNGTLMHRVDHERIREEPRVMNDHALIPVNAFGIPQETMRCLELAESVNQMTDLIDFANKTKLGPMDALAKLAEQLREGSQGKSLLDPDAARPRDWRRNPYLGPSNESPHQRHSELSTRNSLYPPSARPQPSSEHLSLHQRALSSLPPRTNHNTDDTPIKLNFPGWARNLFFSTRNRRNDEGIELQEHRPAVVSVPLGQANPRNYSRQEVEIERKKAREKARKAKTAKAKEKQKARDANNAKNTKSASTGSSRSSQNNVTQHPGGATQIQPTPELRSAGISTSSAAPIIATRWTRFWSTVCCMSAQNADGNH